MRTSLCDQFTLCGVSWVITYINGKGRDGQGGSSYGNINPQSTKWQQGPSEQEIPF